MNPICFDTNRIGTPNTVIDRRKRFLEPLGSLYWSKWPSKTQKIPGEYSEKRDSVLVWEFIWRSEDGREVAEFDCVTGAALNLDRSALGRITTLTRGKRSQNSVESPDCGQRVSGYLARGRTEGYRAPAGDLLVRCHHAHDI